LLSGLLYGSSVPASRSTLYWAAVRSLRHSASVWVTAKFVWDGDDIALAAQALTATIDSTVTLAAVRNRRLVTSISPIPLVNRKIQRNHRNAARGVRSPSTPFRHGSVRSSGRGAGIRAPLFRKNWDRRSRLT